MLKIKVILISLLISSSLCKVDQNFYIFLAFGSCNMEGGGVIQPQDITGVPERFKMMAAVDFPSKFRKKGEWYTAVPPLCRETTGLSPLDYFGRMMVEKLPPKIKIGVVNVSVGGSSIAGFDPDKARDYYAEGSYWLKQIAEEYNNDPFRVLVEMGKKAKKDGVIKGILMNQGEADTGDDNWPNDVKKIYNRLIQELELVPNEVPLLVGELVNGFSGGVCFFHNQIIDNIRNYIPNAHVVSSVGCGSVGDGLHFSSQGYRNLGERYAEIMFSILK